MTRRKEERRLVARNVRLDTRKRVSGGAALADLDDASFNVHRKPIGRIILEPQVSVPTAEAWLFRDKAAAESVARGLKQIKSATPVGLVRQVRERR
jgi:hypothetical protein